MENIKKNKYINAKIYKIIDLDEQMIYIGSTIQMLCKRFASHIYLYKNKINNLSSFEIFDKYGIENCKILLIENYPCNSREELCKKEGEYIKKIECVNKRVAGRTFDKYYEDNKKEIIKKMKNHYDENKEEIIKKRKNHYKENKEEINKIRLSKICCPKCNNITSKTNIKRHQKSKKCIQK